MWACLLTYAVALALVVAVVSTLLAGYARQIPGSASVDPAFAAQGAVFDAALGLALAPSVAFSGSFTSDAGERVSLHARVSNEGSMLATLSLAGQEADYLAAGDRRFIRAGEPLWRGLGESAAHSALYAGTWTQVDTKFLGVDLSAVLAPQRLAWVIADPAGLAATGAPGAVEDLNGVPARPVRAGELTVWISQDEPPQILRIRTEDPAADHGDLSGGGARDLLPDPDPGDPAGSGDPDERPGGGPDPNDPDDPGAPPIDDPAAGGGPEELDIPDFEADLAEETLEQAQQLLQNAVPERVRELPEAIDSRISFALAGEIVLAPCGPNGCTANTTLTNTISSTNPEATITATVNAEVTTTMTLDGAPVQTCVTVVPMPPNGSASTPCVASYYVPPSQTPRTYVVAAESIALARALIQADIDTMLTALTEEQAHIEFLGPDARPIVPGGGIQAHESSRPGDGGGHTLRTHVGATDGDLLGRLAVTANDPHPIPAAASWTSVQMADHTIGGMIQDHQLDIEDWLDDPTAGPTLTLSYTGTTPVTGRYVARGSTTVSDVTGAIAVLQRSVRGPGAGLGYIIETSYPTPA